MRSSRVCVQDERSDDKTAYLYVQFESRRKGYIDDMEVARSVRVGMMSTHALCIHLIATRLI